MALKIKIYGKAQNRTVLGIVHSYLTMYPEATLNDLRQAFPNDLCPDAGVTEILLPLEQAEALNATTNLYFTKPDEVLTLSNGSKIALAQIWSKTSFDKIVERAKQYDITVAEFEKTIKGEKGGFRLEYLNGYMPKAPKMPAVSLSVKRKSRWWLWLLLILAVVIIIYLLFRPAPEPQIVEVEKVVEKVVEKEVVVRDTVYMQQIQEIEKNFNAAQFEQGKAVLNDDAKFALHDLAKVLKQNPELRLSITGHTSVEGNADKNLKLSEARAQAAVDFLVNKEGIEAGRLTAVGKGSSEPIDTVNLEANRRTEFKIVE